MVIFTLFTMATAYVQFTYVLGVPILIQAMIFPILVGAIFGYMYSNTKNLNHTLQNKHLYVQSIMDAQESMIIVLQNNPEHKRPLQANQKFLIFFKIANFEKFTKTRDSLPTLFEAYCTDIEVNWLEAVLQNLEYECIVKFRDPDSDAISYFNIRRNLLSVHEKSYVLTFEDVTTLQEEKLRYAHEATTDHLTSVMNRQGFNTILSHELKLSDRYKTPFSIILLDIDHFKNVNDVYGHNTGDAILIRVAQTIKSAIRGTDVVARWGGEEFIVFLPNTNQNQAFILTQKLRSEINELTHLELEKNVTCSFGISQYQEDDTDKSLIERADKALYYIKENGRDGISIN
jgi:diguanylate cyclase (GGDEF)-like protein